MEPRLSQAESIQCHWHDPFQPPRRGASKGFLNCSPELENLSGLELSLFHEGTVVRAEMTRVLQQY